MSAALRLVLALLVLPAAALVVSPRAVQPIVAAPAAAYSTRPAVSALVLNEANNNDSDDQQDSLYNTPKFEFDAVTITALLGGAIAFQFFVLANL